jgi:O-antigen/teichoic acid export membrane protein
MEFGFTRPGLLPGWIYWNHTVARKILSTGVMFFVLSLCNALNVPLDNIVITQVLGPAAVTQYSVPMRFFQLVTSLAAMFVIPLWPAYGEALARHDVSWVRSTVYHSLGYSALILTPLALGLATMGKLIIYVWVGAQVQPTYILLFGMAVWTILMTLNIAISMFMSGVNELKFQIAVSVVASISSLGLRIVMARAFGISGVIWASVLAFAVADAILILHVPRLLRRMENHIAA